YLLTLSLPSPSSPLSLHDALPISFPWLVSQQLPPGERCSSLAGSTKTATTKPLTYIACAKLLMKDSSLTSPRTTPPTTRFARSRSEEHTSELQSRFDLVCRLLLEK